MASVATKFNVITFLWYCLDSTVSARSLLYVYAGKKLNKDLGVLSSIVETALDQPPSKRVTVV